MVYLDSGIYIYGSNKGREKVLENLYSGMNKAKTKLNYLDSVYVYPKSLVTRDLVNKAKDRFNKVLTDHYKLKGKESTGEDVIIDIWYDKFGRWAKMIFIKDGSEIEYFLDTNNPIEHEYRQFLDSPDKNILSYITEENNTELQSLWKSRNKVFTEDAFISLINDDNKATYEDFIRIQQMLTSTSEPDREIGATLLSNFSWSDNEDLLMFLLFKHIDWLRYSKAYNGASFKAIKALYKDYRHSTSSHATLIKKLFEKSKLTSAGLKEFLEDKAKDLNNTYYISNQFFSFTIDSINLPKEYDEIRSQL